MRESKWQVISRSSNVRLSSDAARGGLRRNHPHQKLASLVDLGPPEAGEPPKTFLEATSLGAEDTTVRQTATAIDERMQSWVVDYSEARARAIAWLGDRYLLVRPITKRYTPGQIQTSWKVSRK